MQKPPITLPPYKPPPQIQNLLNEQQNRQSEKNSNQQRRRTAVLPKRNWIQRNPRLFQITCLTTSLLVFFSKPLYDAFIADPIPQIGERIAAHKR